MQQITMEQLSAMRGAPVYDSDGDKIGAVEEIFYDVQRREPEWLGVGTGFLGTKRVLVPMAGATPTTDGLAVAYPKDKVKDSPDIDSDEISAETEQELYAYYGLSSSAGRSKERSRKGRADEEAAVTRHEEELAVGKRATEAGGVRLRKWVETEPVEAQVELKRETARVTREPVDKPVDDAEIGEEEVDVTLRGEEPVVEKKAVAKERIGVEKDVERKRETVTDEVRKERVEVDDDSDR